jgi:predicted acetyltransferase
MPVLIPPTRRCSASFLAAVREIRAAGESEHTTGLSILPPVGEFPGEAVTLADIEDPGAFAAFTKRLRELADPRTWLPEGIVPATHLWWVDGATYLGRLSIRHSLTPWLLEFGGHIGYGVRPSARRQGHATAMLAAALPVAHRIGIDSALLTCDDTNVASRKVIEANAGVLEDQRGVKLRYWVPTVQGERDPE